jgi:guanylate kinase
MVQNLLIIDGPSAVGKSTLVNYILQTSGSEFEAAKRVTTRPRRNSDEDDHSYEFIDETTFEMMIVNNELVEYHHYLFGMSYGLPKQNVLNGFSRNKNVIGIINLGNVFMVKKTFPSAFSVFLDVSLETIAKRLQQRGIHTSDQIEERLTNAKNARELIGSYDLVVKNENIEIPAAVNLIIRCFHEHNSLLHTF